MPQKPPIIPSGEEYQGYVFVVRLENHRIKVIQEVSISSTSFHRFTDERNKHVHPLLKEKETDVADLLSIWLDPNDVKEFVDELGKKFLIATDFIIKSAEAQLEERKTQMEETLSFYPPYFESTILRRVLFKKPLILVGEFPLHILYEFYTDQAEYYVYKGEVDSRKDAFDHTTNLLRETLRGYVSSDLPIDVSQHWKRSRNTVNSHSKLEEPRKIIPILLKLLFRFIEGVSMVGDIPNAQVFTLNLISFEGSKLFQSQDRLRQIESVERHPRRRSDSMIECVDYFGLLCSKSEEYKMNGYKDDVTFVAIGTDEFVHKSNVSYREGLKGNPASRRCLDNYLQKVSFILFNEDDAIYPPDVVSFQTFICPLTGTRKFYIQVGRMRRRVLSMRYIFEFLCEANGLDPQEVTYPLEIPGGEHDAVFGKALTPMIERTVFDAECQRHFTIVEP